MHFRLSPADPAPARPARSLQSSTPTKSFASISAKCRASCSLPQPAKRRIARMKVRGTRHRPYTWHLVTIPNRVAFSTMTKIRYHTTRSEEHTSELQSLMRISYAVFSLKKKKNQKHQH